MSLSIKTNLSSLESQRHIRDSNKAVNKSNQRLVSGTRVIDGSDGGAELSISQNMQSKVSSLRKARQNADNAVSLLGRMQGGLGEISNLLIRLRELSLQAASATVSDDDRKLIMTEVGQSLKEIDRIAGTTHWNEMQLLGGKNKRLDFQIGLKNDFTGKKSLDLSKYNMNSSVLGVNMVDLNTQESAQKSIEPIAAAQDILSELRSELAMFQNSLQLNSQVNDVNETNLSAAKSRVKDTDIAEEVSEKTRKSIAANAGVSLLAQANNDPKKLVSLFDAGPGNPMIQGPIRASAPIQLL